MSSREYIGVLAITTVAAFLLLRFATVHDLARYVAEHPDRVAVALGGYVLLLVLNALILRRRRGAARSLPQALPPFPHAIVVDCRRDASGRELWILETEAHPERVAQFYRSFAPSSPWTLTDLKPTDPLEERFQMERGPSRLTISARRVRGGRTHIVYDCQSM